MYYYLPNRQPKKAKVSTLYGAVVFFTVVSILLGITLAITTVTQKETPRNDTFFEPEAVAEAKEIPQETHLNTTETTTQNSPKDHIKRLWGDQADTIVAIACAESGFRCEAINETLNSDGSWDAGLLQVNSVHGRSKADMLNCHKNIDQAYKIYQSQGLKAWSAYNNGTYKKFLSNPCANSLKN